MQRSTQSPNALQLIGKFALTNKMFTAWLGSGALAGCLALSPVPYGQVAGAALFSATSATAASRDGAQKRIKEAEQAGKLNRSKFESEVKRLNEDNRVLAQAQAQLATKEAQLTAVEASLTTQQRTMKDRMTIAAHKEAQAKVEAMQTRLEAALADKAAMQATYAEKSTAMAKNTGLIVSKVQQSRKDLGRLRSTDYCHRQRSAHQRTPAGQSGTRKPKPRY